MITERIKLSFYKMVSARTNDVAEVIYQITSRLPAHRRKYLVAIAKFLLSVSKKSSSKCVEIVEKIVERY